MPTIYLIHLDTFGRWRFLFFVSFYLHCPVVLPMMTSLMSILCTS